MGNDTTDMEARARAQAKEAEANSRQEVEILFSQKEERVGRKYFQMAVAFAANLGMMSYGLICPTSGFLLPQLEDPETGFGITTEEGSWFASLMVVGSLTGALFGGWQCGRFGRRLSMMFDCFLYILGILMVALAPNFPVMLAGRLITGHSAASSMVAIPIYTSEISQPQVRRKTGTFTIMCYTTGFALVLVFGAVMPWRWAVGCCAVVPFACFFMLIFCPESPVWLMTKGRDEEAKQHLTRLRGEHNQDIVEAEFKRIELNLKMQAKEEAFGLKQPLMSRIKELMVDTAFLRPFLFLTVSFSIAFEWTGLPAIAFYMVTILSDAQIPMNPFWASAMLASYRAVVAILGSPLAGNCRRRPVFLSCVALSFSGLTSMAMYCYLNLDGSLSEAFPLARWIPVISILIIYTAFAMGLGPVLYMMQGELLPAHSRSVGSGMLGILDNISLFFSTKMVPTFVATIGMHGTFSLYACCCLFIGVFAFFCMPETLGLSLEDIEAYYRSKVTPKKEKSPPPYTERA